MIPRRGYTCFRNTCGPSSAMTDDSGSTLSRDLSSALSSRQSKSSSEIFLEFSELENSRGDKNSKCLVCRHCKCKVLKPGYGTLLEREVNISQIPLLQVCALGMYNRCRGTY